MGAAIDGCQMTRRAAAAAPATNPHRRRRRRARTIAGPRPRRRRRAIGNEIFRTDDGGKTWRKTHVHDVDVAGGKAPYSFNQLKIDTGQSGAYRRHQRHDVLDARRRQDVGMHELDRILPPRLRRLPDDLVGPRRIPTASCSAATAASASPTTAAARRRRSSTRRSARSTRSASTWTIRTTSTPACRITTRGRGRRTARTAGSRSITGRRSGRATACTTRSIRPTRAGSTTRARWAITAASISTTGQRTVIAPPAPAGATLRYNWVAPIVLSPHNPQTSMPDRSSCIDRSTAATRGRSISPDLTTNDPGNAAAEQFRQRAVLRRSRRSPSRRCAPA